MKKRPLAPHSNKPRVGAEGQRVFDSPEDQEIRVQGTFQALRITRGCCCRSMILAGPLATRLLMRFQSVLITPVVRVRQDASLSPLVPLAGSSPTFSRPRRHPLTAQTMPLPPTSRFSFPGPDTHPSLSASGYNNPLLPFDQHFLFISTS